MLTYDPEKRITSADALKSPWLYLEEETKLTKVEVEVALAKLKHFKTQTALQRAVLTYFATLQLLPQEEEKLRETFGYFDSDHDGHLSIEDLIRGYETIYGNKAKAKQVAERIMHKIDLNRNGLIDFTGKNIIWYFLEFSIANLEINHFIKEDKLKEAFNFIDKDKDGKLSIKELRNIFGPLVDQSTLERILQESDTDHDNYVVIPFTNY